MPHRLDCDAPLAFDASGAPVSLRYGDIYRSRSGAWAEAQQVFVEGCGLAQRWSPQASGIPSGAADRFCVLELGFGLGINFLATRATYAAATAPPHRLNYVAIEAHPVSREELVQAHEALDLAAGEAADFARDLRQAWPLRTPGLHRLSFDQGRVILWLAFGDVGHLLPRLRLAADAIYLDGFSPARNPAMWRPEVMAGLARLCRPGALLASYSVARSVCDSLERAGFEPMRVPGIGSKRQRLVARYYPRWRSYPPPPPVPIHQDRRALIIGAGLAGTAIAARLVEEGWAVRLIEASSAPGQGGSGQPWCADHVHISPDDNVLARLSRSALFLAKAARHRLSATHAGKRITDDITRTIHGRLVLGDSPDDAFHQEATLRQLGMPDEFVRFVDATAASDIAGIAVPSGGLWFPLSEAVSPRELITARIASLRTRDAVLLDHPVASLQHQQGLWYALGARGETMANAPVVILACAPSALALAGVRAVSLRRVRGQTTWLRSSRLAGLKVSLGGAAYVVPDGSRALIGASYDDGEDLCPSPDADISNVRRLARLLREPESALGEWQSASLGYRYAPIDRMPLIGLAPDEVAIANEGTALSRNARLPLPTLPSVFMATGLGSRGSIWSELAAEMIVAQLLGDPLPVESDLVAAIDPARELRRALRRSRSG